MRHYLLDCIGNEYCITETSVPRAEHALMLPITSGAKIEWAPLNNIWTAIDQKPGIRGNYRRPITKTYCYITDKRMGKFRSRHSCIYHRLYMYMTLGDREWLKKTRTMIKQYVCRIYCVLAIVWCKYMMQSPHLSACNPTFWQILAHLISLVSKGWASKPVHCFDLVEPVTWSLYFVTNMIYKIIRCPYIQRTCLYR